MSHAHAHAHAHTHTHTHTGVSVVHYVLTNNCHTQTHAWCTNAHTQKGVPVVHYVLNLENSRSQLGRWTCICECLYLYCAMLVLCYFCCEWHSLVNSSCRCCIVLVAVTLLHLNFLAGTSSGEELLVGMAVWQPEVTSGKALYENSKEQNCSLWYQTCEILHRHNYHACIF